jgi:hypothetical protein
MRDTFDYTTVHDEVGTIVDDSLKKVGFAEKVSRFWFSVRTDDKQALKHPQFVQEDPEGVWGETAYHWFIARIVYRIYLERGCIMGLVSLPPLESELDKWIDSELIELSKIFWKYYLLDLECEPREEPQFTSPGMEWEELNRLSGVAAELIEEIRARKNPRRSERPRKNGQLNNYCGAPGKTPTTPSII